MYLIIPLVSRCQKNRAYGTVVELIRDASQKAQMMHNQEVKQIETEEVIADEMWSFVEKNRKTVAQRS